MRIRSFQGLRPAPEAVEQVVSLPYDVVSSKEARDLAADNPSSMLHVVRAEIDFPPGTDPHSDPVYAKAAENLLRLQRDGRLVRESEPSLYLYQQQMGDHAQQGIVALCHIDDYEAGLIKKHEKTRVDKENDRTRLTAELSANPGPVFLTYHDNAEIDRLTRDATRAEPLYDITTSDSIRHTVWKIPGAGDFAAAFANVPCFYVADGHHRSASAARVGRERRAANPQHTGKEDYNWFLTVLFPGSQLRILPYNRLVHDLNGLNPHDFLTALTKAGALHDTDRAGPRRPGEICVYSEGRWRSLSLKAAEGADPVAALDVSLLQDLVLAPILGIDDPRTSDGIEFVGGIRGTDFLEDAVDSGHAAVAFSMFPVQIEQLMAISDADLIMAPKCTWFEPKLRSGFFIHTF